jgi:hypothetical protein
VFGLADVPDQPAANYSRLARLDLVGLVWLLRNRQVVALDAAAIAMRGDKGSILKYYKPATKRAQIGKPTSSQPTPAKEIDGAVAPIDKPTPVIDAVKQGLGDAAKPAPRNADGVAPLIPEDLSIPEFLRREPKQPAAQVVKAAPISKPVPVRITDAITKQEPAGSPREPISADGTSEAPKAALERSTDGNVLTTAVAP